MEDSGPPVQQGGPPWGPRSSTSGEVYIHLGNNAFGFKCASAMLQSLWKSISSWGELPANFPYTLGPAVPYGFELPGGFVQFYANSTKPVGGSEAADDKDRRPILDSLLNPSKGGPVSVFAFKRDKQQSPPLRGKGSSCCQYSLEQAKNHLVKCKTLLHPNLLKVIATYETNTALYVVTECCFSLPHVLYLSQQQQQQQTLAAKRPASLPPPQSSESSKAAAADLSDGACYAAAAAAAAEAAAGSSCWNLLELIGALSFLHDQCKLVHGEVSPFSVFVTPHGEPEAERLCYSACEGDRLGRQVHFYLFISQQLLPSPPLFLPVNTNRSEVAKKVTPPMRCSLRLCREVEVELLLVVAAPRQHGGCARSSRGGATADATRTARRALCRAAGEGASEERASGAPELLGFIRALPVKSHVDKEAFFERELPAALQQQRVPAALALHVLLPELALLLLNSSAAAYHCSILKSLLAIVGPPPPGPPGSGRPGGLRGPNTRLPLQLLAEVLTHAFASSDRAIRFALLSQLPAVQALLEESFFLQTWQPLVLGLEDSAPPIRAATARALALYASRLPPDAPQAASVFSLLESRVRDVVAGVRLEAVAAAAAAAKHCGERGGGRPRWGPSLVEILAASLRDSEDSVKIAGLQASAYCSDVLPLTGLVNLLAAAASCFLSASPEVVAATPDCMHALTEAARGAAERQRPPQQTASRAEDSQVLALESSKASEGWLTTVKSLGAAMGLSKRPSNSPAFLARRGSGDSGSAASGAPPPLHPAGGGGGGGGVVLGGAPPPQPPAAPPASSPLSRSADEFKDATEPGISWAEDCEVPADAWEATPDIDALTAPPAASALSSSALAFPPLLRGSGNPPAAGGSQRGSVNARGAEASARAANHCMHSTAHQSPGLLPASGGSATPGMRLQSAAAGSCFQLVGSPAQSANCKLTNGTGAQPRGFQLTDSSTDDFFAALEREAAQRNL
ncbi:hypothetical protein Efla_004836 [Eimeria flavescens]